MLLTIPFSPWFFKKIIKFGEYIIQPTVLYYPLDCHIFKKIQLYIIDYEIWTIEPKKNNSRVLWPQMLLWALIVPTGSKSNDDGDNDDEDEDDNHNANLQGSLQYQIILDTPKNQIESFQRSIPSKLC